MSAFRPRGTPADSARNVRIAYGERAIRRMIANGSTKQHAERVMYDADTVRKARREEDHG